MKNSLTSQTPSAQFLSAGTNPSWLLVGLLALAGTARGAEMSGGDILKKSEAAYAAVKTFVGTTIVRGHSEIGGTKLEQISSAKVTFVRPGKVRIEGLTAGRATSFKEGRPFTIVSDGKKTWKSWHSKTTARLWKSATW